MSAPPPPWDNPVILDAAVDVASRIRDENPQDLVDELTQVPHQQLAELALTLAAMVDVDLPMSALRRWDHLWFTRPAINPYPDLVEDREEWPMCRRGHVKTPDNCREEGPGRLRCKTCDREYRRARRKGDPWATRGKAGAA